MAILLMHSIEIEPLVFVTRVFLDGQHMLEIPGHFSKAAASVVEGFAAVGRGLGAEVRYREDPWSREKRLAWLEALTDRMQDEDDR